MSLVSAAALSLLPCGLTNPDRAELEGAPASRMAGMPAEALRETKRRILFDGERTWGALFADEERLFREALLDGPDTAA